MLMLSQAQALNRRSWRNLCCTRGYILLPSIPELEMLLHTGFLRSMSALQATVLALTVGAQGPSGLQVSRSQGAVVHQDIVGADYSTTSVKKGDYPLFRTVKIGLYQHYDVVVTDPFGIVRMKGSFRDWALEIPDGLFSYYYANGKPESKGEFIDGAKTGTWQCWESDGSAKPDRIYRGKDWERIQVALGLSEQAPTVGNSFTESTPAVEAP